MIPNWHSVLFFGLTVAAVPAAAQPAVSPARGGQCYFVNELGNWRAPDARTIYFRVRGNRYFRLGLGNECHPLRSASARLVTIFRGSNTVCSPLDWDLQVSEGVGSPPVPCIVKTMTPLSQAEVAALPAKAKP